MDCRNCKYCFRLKHNFKCDKGFEETNCCCVFINEPNSFIIEVEDNDFCEMFEERDKGIDKRI